MKRIAPLFVLASTLMACSVATESETQSEALTTTGCHTIGSGGFKGGILCDGVAACGTHTNQFFWGTEVLSNGPKLDTGDSCCADDHTCNGVKADTKHAFECTNFVMRHFRAMGPKFDITDSAYTGTMCSVYGSSASFDVYDRKDAVPEPHAGDVIVFGKLHDDGAWGSGHTAVISSYERDTSDVWFYQQNAKGSEPGQLLAKDHTTYSPTGVAIADRYNLQFRCLIRAKNVCENVGQQSSDGCGGDDVKTCEGTHQWSACKAATNTGKSCKSTTLAKSLADGTCLQSGRDGDWYHCDDGSWVAGETACTATYAWCHSGTLDTSVPPRTCVQSAHDHVWYQCSGDGWESGVSNGAGPLGACSSEYAL